MEKLSLLVEEIQMMDHLLGRANYWLHFRPGVQPSVSPLTCTSTPLTAAASRMDMLNCYAWPRLTPTAVPLEIESRSYSHTRMVIFILEHRLGTLETQWGMWVWSRVNGISWNWSNMLRVARYRLKLLKKVQIYKLYKIYHLLLAAFLWNQT